MSPESPGRRKFSQAVAYHILSDVNGDEFVPVVDGDGMPDKIGGNHGSPGPGLYNRFLSGLIHCHHFLLQFVSNVWTLF